MPSKADPEDIARNLPEVSVLIAARNEESYIGACLDAILSQDDTAGRVEVIVAANACTDGTEKVALAHRPRFAARGWSLQVIEVPMPGKVKALNAADRAARGAVLVFLDADVLCDPPLIGQLRRALADDRPLYGSGRLQVARAKSWVTRRYADLWVRLPFVKGGAVGAGLFAVNRAGRARWSQFPDIISDDTFVRLHFAPDERIETPARYHWPMVEGMKNLIKVRRRQDAGVNQIYRLFPELAGNEAKESLGKGDMLRLFLAAPIGFVIYVSVHLAVRLRPADKDWTRGR